MAFLFGDCTNIHFRKIYSRQITARIYLLIYLKLPSSDPGFTCVFVSRVTTFSKTSCNLKRERFEFFLLLLSC